jgi:hypothetical protein
MTTPRQSGPQKHEGAQGNMRYLIDVGRGSRLNRGSAPRCSGGGDIPVGARLGSLSLGLVSLCALVTAALFIFSASALAAREYVPAGSFGGEGTGNGQFKEPAGVAVNDATHDVYVVDRGNDRVEELTSTGAYVGQFNGTGAPTGVFSSPEEIAVDNSGSALDPSKEDVYVVDDGHKVIDQLTASGTYVGQLKETTSGLPFGYLHGIAVDPTGNVWVEESPEAEAPGSIDEFSDIGGFVKAFAPGRYARPEDTGLAVDSVGDLYLTCCNGVAKFAVATGTEVTEPFGSGVSDLALNPATENLLLDEGSSIALYGPDGEPYSTPLQTFSGEGLSESRGIGVDSSTSAAYATQYAADDVEIFDFVSFPEVTAASPVGATEATLRGSIDPEGEPVTECKFEYGTESTSEHSIPCEQTPTGTSPVPVTAKLNGLEARMTYRFRLTVLVGSSTRSSGELTFYTLDEPGITGESVSNVGPTTATVSAQINPTSLPTSYRVEYGTTAAYGSSTPETSLGAGLQAANVQIQLSGLHAGTVYHARVVASNALGTALGGDLTFTTVSTLGPTASTLPDGRVYELVSSPGSSAGDVYVPLTGHELASSHQVYSEDPVRAATDGDAVAYVAEPPPGSGGSGSTGDGARAASGWSAASIMPPVQNGQIYKGFSNDLSLSFLTDFEPPVLAPDAPPNCNVLYARSTSDGVYHTAFTSTTTPGECGEPQFAGVSADDASVIFESRAALIPGASAGSSQEHEETFNLYDSVAGKLYLVNVLPGGRPEVGGVLGGVSPLGEETAEPILLQLQYGYNHYGQAISADGSRIVWTDLNTAVSAEDPTGKTRLFVRENPASPSASTVQADAAVGGGGQYQGASSDGSKVFFTKAGELYEYDLNTGTTSDLAPGGSVLGLAGVSEDGTYVYFVAAGALASNENANRETPSQGQPNLYVYDAGETRFIATLSSEDNEMLAYNTNSREHFWGDWRASLRTRTSQVSRDGRHLVFMSRRSLTGYDNDGGCFASEEGSGAAGCPEVFVYDAGAQQISCASCNPSGEPPVVARGKKPFEARLVGGAFLPSAQGKASATYAPRWISEDGSRVFFDTAEPLVSQDTNGVQDVYEWERDGTGSCTQAPGCVFLMSSNLGGEEAYFLDANASGDDVFFTSRAQLVPQAGGGEVELYDARVNGGFPHLSTACTGTGCQGVPPAPPIFATPASVTFAGAGNFASSAKPASKAKPKAKPKRCKRGFTKKHGKCMKSAKKRKAAKSGAHARKSGKRSPKGGK